MEPLPTAAARAGVGVARDRRPLIYGVLNVVLAVAYAIALWKLIPNRMLSASIHLWLLPPASLLLGVGTLIGGRRGWRIAIGAGSAMLLLTILAIARILISAAFLAGVYGAFGQGAVGFSLVAIALVVELVALVPVLQVKFLMSRAGRRALRLSPA